MARQTRRPQPLKIVIQQIDPTRFRASVESPPLKPTQYVEAHSPHSALRKLLKALGRG